MDPAVQAALNKWPNVPACYGWLSLDRRGQWRLQGEPVRHAGLAAFMNRNYGCDEQGNWFVQNGPQKVYVTLEYTPWVLRLTVDGQLETHTGIAVQRATEALLDNEGNLLLVCEHGIGLLDDRDLPVLLGRMSGKAGSIATEDQFIGLMEGKEAELRLSLGTAEVRITLIQREHVFSRFGFFRNPNNPSL